MLRVYTDNIPHLDNYDLVGKLQCALHPTINDMEAAQLVKDEIENRKNNGVWETFDELSNDVTKYLSSTIESNEDNRERNDGNVQQSLHIPMDISL